MAIEQSSTIHRQTASLNHCHSETQSNSMGNHQIYPKRQHRPSESVGFNKHTNDDDGRFVTLRKTKNRIWTKSAPPLDETIVSVPLVEDGSKMTFTTAILPFDTYASITGTFTNWTERKMSKVDGEYQITLQISSGYHYYRILVNGRERFRKDETIEDHPKFGRVQFLYVPFPDQCATNPLESSLLAPPKPTEWAQETNPQLSSLSQAPPPRIPPHLSNILLNRKLPAHCDPHLLPEPNSVMLRHLYALSIRNGMMILSSTIRYRQKFVTLCFYKPI